MVKGYRSSITLIGLVFSTALVVLVYTDEPAADQIRYMDQSGNIIFVDKLSQVPKEYMNQIMTPTPTPALSKQEVAELQRKRRAEQMEKERKERERKRDEKERQKKLDQLRKKQDQDDKKHDDSRELERIGGK